MLSGQLFLQKVTDDMLDTSVGALLKTDITVTNAAALASMVTAEDWPSVANWYNTVPPSPTLLWRPAVPVSAMAEVIDWSAFAALTALKQNTYIALTNGGVINATALGVRSSFVAIFGAGSATLTALTALAQQAGTRWETFMSVNNVSSVFGQKLNATDIQHAMLS